MSKSFWKQKQKEKKTKECHGLLVDKGVHKNLISESEWLWHIVCEQAPQTQNWEACLQAINIMND